MIIEGTIGILFLLMVPGLAVSLALYPKKDEISFAERAGMSFILGLIPHFLLYAASKNLDIPVNTTTTLLYAGAVSAIGLVLWQIRTRNIHHPNT